ncbi:MADF DNA bdg domain containing protein, partial [Asbolus verrucosus]
MQKARANNEKTVNTRLFIKEIKSRKPLWDQSNRNYHKEVLLEHWREIAAIFDIEVSTAKQKWKNLRDTFRIE